MIFFFVARGVSHGTREEPLWEMVVCSSGGRADF